MKTNLSTTQEQSARLLRCGVSADTADMCWYKAKSPNKEGYSWMLISENYLKRHSSDEFVPAWSLSALLGLLPKRIKRGDCSDYTLSLSCDGCFWDLEYTYSRYCGEDDSLVLFEDTDLIEVCVKAIEWLMKRGYKLNEQ